MTGTLRRPRPRAGAAAQLISQREAARTAPNFACPGPVPLTVRGTQALVSFAPLALELLCAARQNAVLRRSSFPSL